MLAVQIKSINREARDVVSLEFVAADGVQLPHFEAGSHIDVHLPNGLIRQYSLCNAPHERDRYVVGVLLDPNSRGGSKAVHELLEGAEIKIGEPRNFFPLVEAKGRSLLFAGGIGITPILCMAESLQKVGANFELHYCSRSREQAAFVGRIEQAPFAGHASFHFDDEKAADIPSLLSSPGAEDHLYVCGPSGFMDFVLKTAEAQGWAAGQLHREYFSVEPKSDADNGSFEVQIASTGQIITVGAETTAAEALIAVGVDIPLSCEQGICGTCVTRVLDGVPEHRDMYLTEDEQKANDVFTPCCSRAKTARLVLDI
ncbi:vanillate O-demethylase ferredoxin subunit [Pseudomonas sp. OG7]|jgi:vanillate O-demethylase ferredoxin subunit|uniref:PDR/VanB family oxidoreductase n=1 Tax=Pseudomonas sp. OG7 TaxID=2587037 RepID=UPI00161370E7|nr:PDR/VanB family oxidoreductase [Pseudomonas sp. OG7]MBB3273905.1 vanillate O-demethylase ferredoxin subunit [Pseudomonas sp. OG7]